MTACGTKGDQGTATQGTDSKEIETTVTETSSNETVVEETSEPEVEEVAQEDSSEETVVETEDTVEEQAYTDFDAWTEELLKDENVFPKVLVWNAETNKHEVVSIVNGYENLEDGDKVYVSTDDAKTIICNGEGIYDAEDELFRNKYDGVVYIELQNINPGEKNNITAEYYSYEDSLLSWEVE